MKWYKKQLDQLKKTGTKITGTDEIITSKRNSFNDQKLKTNKSGFINPVAVRNINRPKTDTH